MNITMSERELGEVEIGKLVRYGVPVEQAERYTLGQFLEFVRWNNTLEAIEEITSDGVRKPFKRIYPYDFQYESMGRQRRRSKR